MKHEVGLCVVFRKT